MEQDDKDFIVFEQTIGKSLDLMWQELSANDISRVRHNLFLMQQGFQNREAAKRIFETIKSYLLGTNDDEIAHDFILDLVLRGMDDWVLPLIDYSLSFLSEKPYKINVFSVLIVEMLNLNSRNTLEANRATLLTLLSEITRARDTINEAKALDKENEIIEEPINLSYSQIAMQSLIDIPSTAPNFYLLFAYTLRQTAIVHIPEFLSYYQTKHEDGDYFLFLRGVLNENEDLFSKAQIETINEWIIENKGIQAKRKLPNITDERLIKIKADKIEPLFDILKEYFDEKQHDLLKAALEGKNIDTKLLFNGKSNRLIYVFAELKQKYHLDNLQEEIIKWIENLFVFTDSQGEIVTAAYNTIKNVLTNKNNAPKPPIDLSEL